MLGTALVTGSSVGIGAGIAERLCRDGYRTAVHCNRHAEKAQELCARLVDEGYTAISVRADLRDEDEILAMCAQVRSSIGAPDVLVNNAGAALPQKVLQDVTSVEWDELFCVNTRSMYIMTRALLPEMISKKRGAIVNISSMWGVCGGSCEVAYSASKAAVIGFTKSLAKELAPSGIRVNCIAPGFVDTAMNASLDSAARAAIIEETPLLRAGTVQDIASAVSFFVSDDASFITGQTLCVDGGRCI